MLENTRSNVLILARFGAVAFALSACGYMVVTAQRRANPAPVVTTTSVAEPAVNAAAHDEMFLQGSKSLVLDASEVVDVPETLPAEAQVGETHFLSSSKTLNWTAHPNSSPQVFPPISATTEPAPAAGAEFLPSSKVGVIVTPEPVFLPSSKVKTLSPLRPQAATSGTPAADAPVFLQSSKAPSPIDLEKIKLPPTKPAPAPAEPPKNP